MMGHLVILGAGASKAGCPKGDRNGKKIPLMEDLIEILNIRTKFPGLFIENDYRNFEQFYSQLYKQPKNKNHIKGLESHVYDYFDSLEISDEPSLYDHLILSLNKKDKIATFNWDPLIVQACVRCSAITKDVPNIFFLHGNTGITYDIAQQQIYNKIACPDKTKSKLLFPIEDKDYSKDPFLKKSWGALEVYLKRASMCTIFGYSAPKEDQAAIKLIQQAWKANKAVTLAETEIIDIESENKVRENWKNFPFSHHYEIYNSFYKSTLGLFPRESCEKLVREKFENECITYPETSPLLALSNWNDVRTWLE